MDFELRRLTSSLLSVSSVVGEVTVFRKSYVFMSDEWEFHVWNKPKSQDWFEQLVWRFAVVNLNQAVKFSEPSPVKESVWKFTLWHVWDY